MAINNPYIPGDPYSYDLKWIVEKVKQHDELYGILDDLQTELENYYNTTSQDLQDLRDYVNNYFNNLDLTAEVRSIIDQMEADGYFDTLVSDIVVNSGVIQSTVTDWLTANVTPVGSAVTVDESLTISGSAADAKVAGDLISFSQSYDDMKAVPFPFLRANINNDGTISTGYTTRCASPLISLSSNEMMIIECDPSLESNIVEYVGGSTTYTGFSAHDRIILQQGDFRITFRLNPETTLTPMDCNGKIKMYIMGPNAFDDVKPEDYSPAYVELTQGGISGAGVPDSTDTLRLRTTEYLTEPIYIKNVDAKFQIKGYDSSDVYIGESGWIYTDLYIDPSKYSWNMQLVFGQTSDAAVYPARANAIVEIYRPVLYRSESFDGPSDDPESIPVNPLRPGTGKALIPFGAYSKTGRLFAGCDFREGVGNDDEAGDIYITHSDDNGATWSSATKLLERGTSSPAHSRVQDGLIVVTDTGRIIVFGHWCDTSATWQNIDTLDPERYNFDMVYKYSDDDGATWSAQQSLQYLYISDNDIVTMFPGVGSGIVTDSGTIIVPVQYKMTSSNVGVAGSMFKIQSGFIYSNDNGASWLRSPMVPSYTSECNIVETSNGNLIINCRGYISRRKLLWCRLTDNPITWHWLNPVSDLFEPGACQGSFVKMSIGNKNVGLFCNPNNTNYRYPTVLQKTYDFSKYEAVTNISSNPATNGYTCIAQKDGRLVVFFDDNYGIRMTDLTKYVPAIF